MDDGSYLSDLLLEFNEEMERGALTCLEYSCGHRRWRDEAILHEWCLREPKPVWGSSERLQEVKGCSGHMTGVTQTSRLTRFSTPCVNISVQQEKRIKNLRLKSGECRLCSEEQKKDYRKSKLVPKLPPKRKIKECRLVPVFPAFLRKTRKNNVATFSFTSVSPEESKKRSKTSRWKGSARYIRTTCCSCLRRAFMTCTETAASSFLPLFHFLLLSPFSCCKCCRNKTKPVMVCWRVRSVHARKHKSVNVLIHV